MIIDWLLQEVPQDLLAKLEVYTFGNAANHFNNPHLHLLSQHAALSHPSVPATTKTLTSVHYHDPITPLPATTNSDNQVTSHPRSTRTESASGKTIRYIEHYAHTSDFVARWGVLHFTCNFSLSPTSPRYMGRVFERAGEGHQFCQHYLDCMFPLQPASSSPSKSNVPPPSLFTRIKAWLLNINERGGVAGSGFVGAREDGNAFMDSVLKLGHDGDENSDEREGVEISYLGAHGEPLGKGEKEVLVRDMSPISPSMYSSMQKRREFERERGLGFTNGTGNRVNREKNGVVEEVVERSEEDVGFGDVDGEVENGDAEDKMEFRVRDLSRLWLYINGKSPKSDEVDVGIARMATV